MVRLEELRDNEKVLAHHDALGEALAQRLAHLLLVAVRRGAVDEPVARLDGRLDSRVHLA